MNFTSHEILKLIVKGTFEISLYWLTLDKNKWLSQKKKKKNNKEKWPKCSYDSHLRFKTLTMSK